jgi:thioesterase domain-containing protein
VKIIYLHQYFNTPAMSGGTRSYEMARRLVAAGHEVNMITSWREPIDKKDWFEEQVDGIRVHWLPVQYSNRFF